MYNEYFGFKEAPFSIAPDPRYLYMTNQHREALAHLVFGLNSDGGCILLTGEVGTGKTTICRCLLEQIPDQANVALVLNPKLNEIELLETLCDELHISYPDSNNSLKTYTDRIHKFLIESNRRNEKTVLIIDEAQNLDSKVLEQLRLLTNLETNQRKLLQIIILGQPELLDILAKTEMRQLAQRITARFHLKPLEKHEVKAYISHRLAVAGQNIQLFPDNSTKLLYKFSKGVPRLINIICDRALLGAYVENQYTVTPSIVKKATKEVFGELKNVEKQQKNKRWLYPIAAFFSTLLILSLTGFFFLSTVNVTELLSATNVTLEQEKPSDSNAKNSQSTADRLTIEDDLKTESTSSKNIASSEKLTPSLQHNKTNNIPTIDGKTLNSDENHDAVFKQDLNKQGARRQGLSPQMLDVQKDTQDERPEPGKQALNKNATDKQTLDELDAIVKYAPRYPATAYQELFKTWDQHYNSKIKLTACKQAERLSLSCLFSRGNIDDLIKLNRPAILTLINERGRKRYITLTSIDNNVATVFSNNLEYKIPLPSLEKYWYGRYTLLWNKPEYYTSAISPGDSGDIIYWLNTQLDKINSTFTANTIISKYNDLLISKVKAFQSQQGLTTDGIVGPATIIHMNNESGVDVPYLVRTSPEQPSLVQPSAQPLAETN